MPPMLDIGIFAHDEETRITNLIADLGRQDIFACENISARILVLANGCRDATIARAQEAIATLPSNIAAHFDVVDLSQGGKSRTGHLFIHDLSRPKADILGFMDADIHLPHSGTLRRMVEELSKRPELRVFTSRPIKDVTYYKLKTGLVGRLIAAGGDGLTHWRKSICGQLFMVKADPVRRIGLPTGLPVEDGFFRAMLLTDLLSAPEDLDRIDGHPEVFHIYRSIRDLHALVRHQTRIVIGGAVNAVLYRRIRHDAPSEVQAHDMLMAAAAEPDWLPRILSEDLPRRPYGYVPTSFLFKRLHHYRAAGGSRTGSRPKAILILLAGLGMDTIVWLRASWAMYRGSGAGHW